MRVIAIDFDGTLCENAYPDIGAPRKNVINCALKAQKNGATLILWTCRSNKLLENAVSWCKEQGLVFDAVNENTQQLIDDWGTDPRKIGATEFWDDLAININELKG